MGKMKFEVLQVGGMYPALYGMRFPMKSTDRMDSTFDDTTGITTIGEKDMILAKKLIKAGSEHRKFLRQIMVWCEIRAPRYIWQELDTYRFVEKNSESTMHSLLKNNLSTADFYTENSYNDIYIKEVIYELNLAIEEYHYNKCFEEKEIWFRTIKQMLPENFLQSRQCMFSYETALNIYKQRKNHRLKNEWGVILEGIENLPYFKELCLED